MKINKRLLREAQEEHISLMMTVGAGVLGGVALIMQAYYLSHIIDGVFLAGQSLIQVSLLMAGLSGVFIVRTLVSWGSEVMANRVAVHVKNILRKRLFAHLLALGPTYTRSERAGELTGTLVEGVEALHPYFSQYLPHLCLTIIVPLIILMAVGSVDPLSGLILLLTAPLLPFFMILLGTLANTVAQRQWRVLSLMSAHFLDVLQGLTTLKLFGHSQQQGETIRQISERFRTVTMSVLRVAFLSSLVLEIGATISTALIAVEVGLRVLYGQMAFAPALFVLLLAPEFYLPLRTLGTSYHAGIAGEEAARRIFEVLDTPAPVSRPSMLPASLVAGGVLRFEDVYYNYGDQRPALQGVSFTLYPGQKLALGGPSGSGKSAIAHLLLRFIEPTSGNVTVTGITLRDLDAREWRWYVGWVPQRPYLFNTTVAENIRVGYPGAGILNIVEAAQQAHAHEFIQALPNGYDTVIGERGARLSGGQIQRLSLARAFLKNAPILVLDEATANLDPEHEELILAATERLMQGRTVLAITHRLHTVHKADQIVVLDQGRVVEVGTHQTLIQHPGLYRQLLFASGGNL